ncbi:MAG: SUMF1/EgtB/PvdO family nonheme iron enzyme [Treponema sp.]|nr:SUMF1/EgtB/PvdO family nonheme iron enzyme [Treponema sp.]
MKKALFIGLFAWLAVSCTKEADDVRPGAIAKNSVTINGVAIDKTAEVYVLTSPITVSSTSDPVFLDNHATLNDKGSFYAGTSVTLKPFIIGKYEVTQELYKKVMEGQKVDGYALASEPSQCLDNLYTPLVDGETQGNRPVDSITWYDAIYFCNVLSEKSGYTPAYIITVTSITAEHITSAYVSEVADSDGYRLPTGAEWEFAARGGNPSKTEWNYMFSGSPTGKDTQGDNIPYTAHVNSGIDPVGWYTHNLNGTSGSHEVGKKNPNSLGLFDMTGNVWEWCFDEEYDTDNNCDGRLERGGGWQGLDAPFLIVTKKYGVTPEGNSAYYDLGFRIVRSVK